MDDFNDVAEAQATDPAAAAMRKLLEKVEETRRNLALVTAAENADWDKAAALEKAGASTSFRSHAALDAALKHDTVEAQRALAGMKLPSYYASMKEGPFLKAAETGNMATLQDGVARNVTPDVMSRALNIALSNKQDTAADYLLQHLKKEDMTDTALFALLMRRPDVYDDAVEGRAKLPDLLGFFYAAVQLNDAPAMDKALGLMIANKKELPLYLLAMSYDEMDPGGPYSDMAYRVLKTGNTAVIDRLIENFGEVMPERVTLLHVSASMKEHPQLFAHLMETLKPTEYDIMSITSGMYSSDYGAAAIYLAEHKPEQVTKYPAPVLSVLAGQKDSAPFIKAVEEQGIPLPKTDADRARVLAAAIENGAKETQDWLLAHLDMTADLQKALQDRSGYELQKRVAELSGTMRFSNDSLFWSAVEKNDKAVIDAFPRSPKLSTEAPWRVGGALVEAVKRGDMELFADIIDNSDWSDNSKRQVIRAALRSEAALEIVAAKGLLPEKIEENLLYDVAENGGGRTLAWLKAHQVGFEGNKLAALRIAINRNNDGMIEHIFTQGIDLTGELGPVLTAIDYTAQQKSLDAIEKWSTRGEKIPFPLQKVEIAAADDLFAGEDSVAIRAAYADGFSAVMKKAAAAPGFDPAILLATKDRHGNNVLDILGAHGRLSDILEPATLWKDRDAVAFIESNTPKIYHAQVDYHGLKAALDLMNLQQGAKNPRFKLK